MAVLHFRIVKSLTCTTVKVKEYDFKLESAEMIYITFVQNPATQILPAKFRSMMKFYVIQNVFLFLKIILLHGEKNRINSTRRRFEVRAKRAPCYDDMVSRLDY